ncbi:hypothetical protein HRE53_30900 (plasmid) [Acaryochloris sp. 'Moss Beach']|uniref:hypothetical protein n=1 Tax=Acaryochloris sp. 'Moss Beach' TaxID=2740837 RepID=UPI001F2A205C|nr:hypothetical protein [Acaryochloris sp. 'Moss Beach']UJB73123.1 hypothetical protein HRE53_30900 [Acaryochloris sp. 'Moss Beach']
MTAQYFSYSAVNIGINLPRLFTSIWKGGLDSYWATLILLFGPWLQIYMIYGFGFRLVHKPQIKSFISKGILEHGRVSSCSFFWGCDVKLAS